MKKVGKLNNYTLTEIVKDFYAVDYSNAKELVQNNLKIVKKDMFDCVIRFGEENRITRSKYTFFICENKYFIGGTGLFAESVLNSNVVWRISDISSETSDFCGKIIERNGSCPGGTCFNCPIQKIKQDFKITTDDFCSNETALKVATLYLEQNN